MGIMDPQLYIKFLPANTTSLIQPMDQAVLACVKAHQKKQFYHILFRYCEENTEPGSFKLFLKNYTILDAIKDIAEGWEKVPVSTIQKSFRKAIPMNKWNALAGNDFEGFGEEEPAQNSSTHVPSDVIPGDVSCGQTVVTNEDFAQDIDEMLHNLNSLQDGLHFEKAAVIEDVLLNPGPTDDNVDNIVREVLEVQDTTGCEEDMLELDSNVQVHTGNIREKLRSTCKRIQALQTHKYINTSEQNI